MGFVDGRSVRCGCGHVQQSAEMPKVGWTQIGGDEWALFANCVRCFSTIAIARLYDAARCATCREVIAGDPDNPKVHVEDQGDGTPLVLCVRCFNGDPRKHDWLSRNRRFLGAASRRMIRDGDLERAQARS